ncbi:S8 family peptidase [Bacteroidia bacterium]|nr:S8 family peptidase [Bacteroidia bacterium]MDB4107206.1 S8 family peptidase [Bacteroidia bacterium]MDB9881879.1 S8 family peptidase [Bacteroidia bacterium]
MQRFIFIIIFSVSSVFVLAQVQMSSSTRQIIDSHSEAGSFLAKVNLEFEASSVESMGGKLGVRVGDIVTIRVASKNASKLKTIKGVEYLQVAHKITPNLKKVISDLRADSVYTGHGLEHGYTGKDVIIGVTDWGFDYTHPMFYDTSMQHTRILAAWDQFKKSGPPPSGYDYGTVYEGEAELLSAEKDTINIYGYATHGSHVAGISAGGGAGTEHRGVAYEANYLMATFLVDEGAVIDAFVWMKDMAAKYNKRLVINMSWGLYNLGPLDGTSLVSQAIDQLSSEGVIFVTSGGNNGDVPFHIKRTFISDTLQTRIEFYGYGSNPNMWGQSIDMWGEEGEDFGAGFTIYDNAKNLLVQSPLYSTNSDGGYLDSFLIVGFDTVFYNIEIDGPHPLNNKPHMRLRVKNANTSLRIGLKAFADKGTVHFYNVTELTTDVGNWGMPFSAFLTGWEEGDNQYSLGEPASTRSVITVAAHQSEVFTSSGVMGGGFIANFSSYGPTIDERMKPDVSAPGVQVASSVSSFTNRNFDLLENVNFNGKNYPFSRFSGTSMSSPATAGVVALMLEANPNLYANEAKVILHNAAREDIRTGDLPETGSVLWGWGKVDAAAAVRASEYKFVGIRNLEVENDVRLYPNPATSLVALDVSQAMDIDIIGSDGRLVFSGKIGGGLQVDVSSWAKGLYFVSFRHHSRESMIFMVD